MYDYAGFMPAAILEEIRARLNALESRSRQEKLPFSLSAQGLPRGALVEITGHGKTEAVALLLAEHSKLRAAWVEQSFSLFPPAFQQRKVNLQNLLFVEGGEECAWAAGALLRSRIFPLLIYSAPYGDERELRRFQLLAEKSATTMLLLGESPQPNAWPIQASLAMREGKLISRRRK
jgi:hypothetical protein